MKGYSETEIFSTIDQAYLQIAASAVQAIPDPQEGGGPWRCHEVARAVATIMGHEKVTVVDGVFAGAQHSWLAWRCERSGDVRILDVYSVGRLPQVQLVDPTWSRELGYVPNHLPRRDIRQEDVEFMVDKIKSGVD